MICCSEWRYQRWETRLKNSNCKRSTKRSAILHAWKRPFGSSNGKSWFFPRLATRHGVYSAVVLHGPLIHLRGRLQIVRQSRIYPIKLSIGLIVLSIATVDNNYLRIFFSIYSHSFFCSLFCIRSLESWLFISLLDERRRMILSNGEVRVNNL